MCAATAADVVWLQREILPGYLTLERFIRQPFLFDVDDAIWLARPFGRTAVAEIARRAAVMVVGNTFLAEWFSPYAARLRVIPTAIDTNRFFPIEHPCEPERRERFVIGWTGIAANFPYLYEIEPALRRFFERRRQAELLVVAEQAPRFTSLPTDRVRFIQWSPDIEAAVVRQMDVGLMPLPDNEWTRGKCSFKMLQYMASGLPVIVSPVGMNADVLRMGEIGFGPTTIEEWLDALEAIHASPNWGASRGVTGRRVVEERFSTQAVGVQLADALREAAS